MASVTVSNLSSDTTFTCSFADVSDTCTVTVPVASYSLAFTQSVYEADDMGNATISALLKNDNVPVSGEPILFKTQHGGTVGTVNTNSSGIASTTVQVPMISTGFSAEYGSLTANCTVNYDPFGGLD